MVIYLVLHLTEMVCIQLTTFASRAGEPWVRNIGLADLAQIARALNKRIPSWKIKPFQEEPMKHEWTIHRQTTARRDGQRRWDLAYQCLLKWAEVARQESLSNPITRQEVLDASSHVCTSIDDGAGRSTDH